MNRSEPPRENVVLSPGERRVVLEDIGRIGLVLGRHLSRGEVEHNLPITQHNAALLPDDSAPLERLAVLRGLWPKVRAAMRGILGRSDSTLKSETVLLPLARTRGMPGIASVLACTPQGANLWNSTAHQNARLPDSSKQSIPEDRLRATTNTLFNCFAATLLDSIQKEASALARLAEFCDAEAEAASARALAEDAAVLRGQRPFRGLAPLDTAAVQRYLAAGQLERCAPQYRVLPGVWRELASVLHFDWSGSPLMCLPALETWHLYEIWCFMQTAAALLASNWRLASADAIRWHASGLRLELVTGQSSCMRFRSAGEASAQVELYYQPYFASANQTSLRSPWDEPVHSRQATFGNDTKPGRKAVDQARRQYGISGIGSRSHVMQPDIALFDRGRLFLLDAKFRDYASSDHSPGAWRPSEHTALNRSAALLEDIDKMHTYRDALHRAGISVVEGAWSLFPGASGTPELFAYPESRPELPFGTAGVGAVRLRPGQSIRLLANLLSSWLAS